MDLRAFSLCVTLYAAPALAQSSGLDDAIPIHTRASDSGEAPHAWAGAPSFKCRLDGRFAFYPALGPDHPRTLPWRWHTESIRSGDTELVDGVPHEGAAHDFRWERTWPGCIEAYDVRSDGVEQTFTIARKPGHGAITILGRVDTELAATPTAEPAHTSLTFRSASGEPLMTYGAATAIDATGQRIPMHTEFSSSHITLRLDAESVASASFPLVVDPILSSFSVAPVDDSAVAVAEPGTASRPCFHAFTRTFSATDRDCFAYRARLDGTFSTLIYADLTADDVTSVDVAIDVVGSRYVLGTTRKEGTSNAGKILFEALGFSATPLQQGSSIGSIVLNTDTLRNISIAANPDDERILAVYDLESATGHTVEARRVDFSFPGGSLTSDVLGTLATVTEPVRPCLAALPDADRWLACWTTSAGGTSRIMGRRVRTTDEAFETPAILYQTGSENFSRIRVAGAGGRYCATYYSSPIGFGVIAIRAHRFDWIGAASAPSVYPRATVSFGGTYTNNDLACDRNTQSQWLAAYTETVGVAGSTVRLARLGLHGEVIDTVQAHGSSTGRPAVGAVEWIEPPSATTAGSWSVQYTLRQSHEVYAIEEPYPAGVDQHPIVAPGCASADTEQWAPAIAGSEFFWGEMWGHNGAAAAIGIALSQSNVPLDSIGMSGCVLGVDPASAVFVPTPTGTSGNATITFRLNDDPVFTGSFYTQWLHLEPGANVLGVVTRGARVHDVQ